MTADRGVALEALEVGAATCLFRPANQAACLMDDAAAAVVAELADGRDATAIAAELADAAQLSHAAALDYVASVRARSLESRLIGPLRPLLAGAPPVMAQRAGAARSRVYGMAGSGSISVTIAVDGLRSLVEAALAPLATPDGQPERSVRAEMESAGNGFAVVLDGLPIVRGADMAAARRVILQAVLLACHARDEPAAILHASAVSFDGHGMLLAGVTGAGKSTLMLALVASGARYLADDFTPLAADGARLLPFPLAASIKKGSWALAGAAFAAIGSAPTFRLGEREVRYLDMSAHRFAGNRGAPAAAIVFPHYAPATTLACHPIAPEEAFRRLIEGGSAPVGAKPSMRAIVELVTRTPSFTLTYSDTAAAVACVARLARPA